MSLMVWGHRGHRYHRYRKMHPDGRQDLKETPHENTLAAYQQVLSKTMGFECDVVQSRTNTPFVVHDTLFDGMVQYELRRQLDDASIDMIGDRFIFQLDNPEIRALRLKDGQAIPRLQDVLELFQHRPTQFINLELKGPNVFKSAIRSVERAIYHRHITPEQVIFSSFNIPALHSLRKDAGHRFRISLSFMVAHQHLAQMYPNWPLAEQDAYYVPFSVDALQRPDMVDICPDFFNIDVTCMNVEALEAIHFFYPQARIILWCSGEMPPEIDTRLVDTAQIYAASGKLFAIVSDYPMNVQHVLQQRGISVISP